MSELKEQLQINKDYNHSRLPERMANVDRDLIKSLVKEHQLSFRFLANGPLRGLYIDQATDRNVIGMVEIHAKNGDVITNTVPQGLRVIGELVKNICNYSRQILSKYIFSVK